MLGEASQLELTFPLESVQDLVKKMERTNRGETQTIRQKHPEEIPKSCKVGFVSIYISSNSLPKPNQSNVDNR